MSARVSPAGPARDGRGADDAGVGATRPLRSLADHGRVAAGPQKVKIEISGLTKRFTSKGSELLALDDIDLQIGDGEFVSVVGPSGCGKSTLLRILGGLDSPTEGLVTVQHEDDGTPLNTIMFQEASVFPWMSVRANVEYGLRARGVPAEVRRQRANEYLGKVNLLPFAAMYPHQLSGGMKQRVSVARTFANDPEILLMDEPFAALDEPNRVLMYEELMKIWGETGKTVLFITHSLEEAIALSDRVVLMTAQPGKIKAIFPVRFERPREIFELKRDPEFGELAYSVWQALHGEVMRARELEAERGA